MHVVKKNFWDEPYIYRSSGDGIIRSCAPEVEMLSVLEECHFLLVGGHHSGIRTAHEIFKCGYYWKTSTKILMSPPRHVIGDKEMEVFLDGKSSL